MAWSGYSETGQGSQERGPRTFSLDLPGVASQARASGAEGGAIRGGIRMVGSGTSDVGRAARSDPRMQVVSVQDNTLSVLMGMAQEALAPRIAKIKQEAEMRGAVRAASGEALVDIVNEQPWYATVFGEAPAVEGARAYTARAATSKFVSDHLANMDNLKAISPEEVPAYLQANIDKHMTGDPGTDLLVQAELVNQLPVLVKAHTKAHVEYMQEKANQATYNAMTAGGDKYQALAGFADKVSDSDLEVAQLELANTFMLPAGRNPDTHWQNVQRAMLDQAKKGNTHVLRAARDTGLLAAMPPEVSRVIDEATRQIAPAVFVRELTKDAELMQGIAALKVFPPEDPDELLAMYATINDRMERLTGIPQDLAKFFDASDMIGAMVGSARSQMSGMAAAQKKINEAVNEASFEGAIRDTIGNPELNFAMSKSSLALQFGLTGADANRVVERVINGVPAEQFGAVLARMPNETYPAISQRINAWKELATNPNNPQPEAAWENLSMAAGQISNPVTVRHHFGEDVQLQISAYQALRAQGLPAPAAALQVGAQQKIMADAIRVAEAEPGTAAGKRLEVVRDSVESVMRDGIYTGKLRGDLDLSFQPDDFQINMLTGMVDAQAKQIKHPDPDARTKIALDELGRKGHLTVGGNGFVLNAQPEEALSNPLAREIGLNPTAEPYAVALLQQEVREQLKTQIGYNEAATGWQTANAIAAVAGSIVTNPIAAGQIARGLNQNEGGFQGQGYYVTRMPRGQQDPDIKFLVVYYRDDGTAGTLEVSSEQVRARKDRVGSARAAEPRPQRNTGLRGPGAAAPYVPGAN